MPNGQDLAVIGGFRFDTVQGEMVPNRNLVIKKGRIVGIDLKSVPSDVKKH